MELFVYSFSLCYSDSLSIVIVCLKGFTLIDCGFSSSVGILMVISLEESEVWAYMYPPYLLCPKKHTGHTNTSSLSDPTHSYLNKPLQIMILLTSHIQEILPVFCSIFRILKVLIYKLEASRKNITICKKCITVPSKSFATKNTNFII